MLNRIVLRAAIAGVAACILVILGGSRPAAAAPAGPNQGLPRLTPGPYTGQPSRPPPAIVYADPGVTDISGTWIGQINLGANVRSGPGVAYPVARYWPAGRKVLVYDTATAVNGQLWYHVGHYPDPDLYIHSSLVNYVAPVTVADGSRFTGRWVDVNLTQQTLVAFENGVPVLLAQVSSGRAGHETPAGLWHIYWRLALDDMDNAGDPVGTPYYNLKDVPWVQYFQESGDALHGTYWHDNFGTPMSHGCVNLSDENALWLFNWAHYGTPVNVHY